MVTYPRSLQPVEGPLPAVKVAGVAEGMGPYGEATRSLIAGKLLPPDVICGMTLTLLARQPRQPRSDGSKPASGVAGRVWVRERFTIHRPLSTTDPFVVTGESTGAHTRKGRTYSTTTSRTDDSAGRRCATNLTTGLLGYKPDPNRPDSVQGLPIEETPTPAPDHRAASENPHLELLAAAVAGERLGRSDVAMTLAMMAARDTDNPDNPIHSDPDEARRAGLARPIAGGSHVLSFALEAIMARFGTESLLHGAFVDARWRAPTEAGTTLRPTVIVTEATATQVGLDMTVDIVDGPTAMVGRVLIPLPR